MRKFTVLVGMAALALGFGLSNDASATPCSDEDAGSSATVHICAEEDESNPGNWNLLVRSDVAIGAGAVGIVNATSFLANTAAVLPSCLFIPCGTQGPNASGDGVVAEAIYFQWAAGGIPPNLLTFGPSPDMQLLGTFTGENIAMTFSGTNTLFGTDEDAPILDSTDPFLPVGVDVGVTQLSVLPIPEPSTYALAGLGLLGLFGMRLRRQ